MNPIRAIHHLARILATALATWLACAAAPAALANPRPGGPGWDKHPPQSPSWASRPHLPPGWNKHPPLPAHAHALATGGLSGWQLTLIAATVILVATAVAVTYRLRATRRRVSATPA